MRRFNAFLLLTAVSGTALAQAPAPAPREKLKLGEWRHGDRKAQLLATAGGTEKTEAAVAAGLKWLAAQQKPDGAWEFTGNQHLSRRVAATGFTLLCFLGAGHAPGDGGDFDKVTADGLAALLKRQDEKTGQFRYGIEYIQTYDQAIGTLALVEAYGMTGNKALKPRCQMAIDVLVKSQTKDGGWRYLLLRPDIPLGDTSVTGWVVQTLTAAKRYTDLEVPADTLEKASAFLETCAKGDKKALFGYVSYANYEAYSASHASGLCSKIALDGWGPGNERLKMGVAELLKRIPAPATATGRPDPYFIYYASRAVYSHGSDAWAKQWNPKLQEYVLGVQDNDGSWPSTVYAPRVGGIGRFGYTCFYLLTLETYYRYPPPAAA